MKVDFLNLFNESVYGRFRQLFVDVDFTESSTPPPNQPTKQTFDNAILTKLIKAPASTE